MDVRTKLSCSLIAGGLAIANSYVVPMIFTTDRFSSIVKRFADAQHHPIEAALDYAVHTYLAIQLCESARIL